MIENNIKTIGNTNISEILKDFIKIHQETESVYLTNCPFHKDKFKTMKISNEKGIYKCFDCGAGGDAIRFVMDLKNLDFVEAVKLISLSLKN